MFRFPKSKSVKNAFYLCFADELNVDSIQIQSLSKFNFVPVTMDEHVQNDTADQSNLCFIPKQFRYLYVVGDAQSSANVTLHAIGLYVSPFIGKIEKSLQRRNDCEQPFVIPQSVWRAGLPPPMPGRVSTPTEHCIIHHSAGGNGNVNYTDLVRSYYTYHTQVNGWDDIGYNYLIAANGDVYAGRDPEKAGIFQDNVQGAHFCGKNQLTMGVCLMGDFTSVQPDARAISSVEQLLGWKISKDNLNPFGFAPHPDKNSASLPVVAGHRDGCSTECPGNNLYALLPQIRQSLTDCANQKGAWYAYMNQGQLLVKQLPAQSEVKLFSMNGELLYATYSATGTDQAIESKVPGLYVLQVISTNKPPETQKVFIH